MTMPNYNLYLSKPFNLLNNVFAVSGRCAHNVFRGGGIGKLGHSIETSIESLGLNSNIFYVYETCNRGPLLFHKKKLEELNYLDEKNYHLDNSDHDIMVRAYLEKKYISGYVPINFNSPLVYGSTRKSDDFKDINDMYKKLRIQQHEIKGENISGNTLNKYGSIYNLFCKKEEQYDISMILPIL